jgi:hypothetical protein
MWLYCIASCKPQAAKCNEMAWWMINVTIHGSRFMICLCNRPRKNDKVYLYEEGIGLGIIGIGIGLIEKLASSSK